MTKNNTYSSKLNIQNFLFVKSTVNHFTATESEVKFLDSALLFTHTSGENTNTQYIKLSTNKTISGRHECLELTEDLLDPMSGRLEAKEDLLESKSGRLDSKSGELEHRSGRLDSKSDELEHKSAWLDSRSDELDPKYDGLEQRSGRLEPKSDLLEYSKRRYTMCYIKQKLNTNN